MQFIGSFGYYRIRHNSPYEHNLYKKGITYVNNIILLLSAFQMEAVQEAMENRGEQYACDNKKDDAGKERIAPCKYLASGGMDGVYRPHAAEYHRGVQERIDPSKAFGEMVSHYAYQESGGSYQECQYPASQEAYQKYADRS